MNNESIHTVCRTELHINMHVCLLRINHRWTTLNINLKSWQQQLHDKSIPYIHQGSKLQIHRLTYSPSHFVLLSYFILPGRSHPALWTCYAGHTGHFPNVSAPCPLTCSCVCLGDPFYCLFLISSCLKLSSSVTPIYAAECLFYFFGEHLTCWVLGL